MSAPGSTPLSASPQALAFAAQHRRPSSTFTGCSSIREYEFLGKLGEGTFG